MKRKCLSILLIICMVLTMLPTTVFAEQNDPVPAPPTAAEYAVDAISGTDYTIDGTTLTIKTAKGAAFWSASGLAYLTYNIKLDADIDVSSFLWTPVGNSDGSNNNTSFSGTFDGQGHTISGMRYANDLQVTAVIGAVSGGTIKNLTVGGSISVTHVVSNEKPACAAGIVGNASDSSITNCHSEVQIASNVTTYLLVGGIVAASMDNVNIDGCSNSGAITGNGAGMVFIGGIVGDMEQLNVSSSIKNCANTGALMAAAPGEQFCLVSLGGIVGNKMDNSNHEDINAVVENSYNTGALEATSGGITYVGGIAGNNAGDLCDHISNCYNAGAVTGSAIDANINGGIVGYNTPGSVYNSYWKTGTADTCVQVNGSIHNCGTFDNAGALSATTNGNAGTASAEHGLLYGNNLLTALNGWVEANSDKGYCKWKADSTTNPVNGGFPVFDVESTETTFDLCNGAPTVSEKPSVDPTWGTTGYTFAGWYTKPNGEGSQLAGAGDVGVTYYAKWTVGMGANLRTVRTTMLDLNSQASDEDKLSTEGWAWYSSADAAPNHTAKTLVLSGLTLNTTEATALSVPTGAAIVLTAKTRNTVKGGDITSNSGNVAAYGIYGAGDLTIQGSGTLNVTGGNAICTDDKKNEYRSESTGVYSKGNLIIADAVTVNVTGGDATSHDESSGSCGIHSEGTLTIQDGTVTGVGGKTAYNIGSADTNSYGIFASSVKISDGTVTGQGGPDSSGSYGIASYSVEISGGKVTGYGGNGKVADSEGIFSLMPIKITGGTVTATGGTATGDATYGASCGMFSLSGIEVNGGAITATGGMANKDSYGIYSPSFVSILGGTVEGIGGNAGTGSYGICSSSENEGGAIKLTITGGRVTAKNGTAGDKAAVLALNLSKEPDSSSTLTVGSTACPATIANASDGTTTITGSRGTIASGKLIMSGKDAVSINFPGQDVIFRTVTFNANGGSVAPTTTNTGADGRLASLPTPSRSGSYSFDGWFTAANGGTSVTTSTVFSADTTIYAHWSYLGGGTNTGGSTYTGGDSNVQPADNNPKTKDTSPVEFAVVSDSNGNASVTITEDKLNEILKAAQQSAVQQGVSENGVVAELTVNTPEDTKSLTLTLSKEVQDTLVKEHVAELKINSSVIEISFDKAAIGAISQTAGTDVQITAKPSALQSAKARTAIGNRPVLDLTLSCGGKTMSSFGKGNVYVGIPYTLGNNEQAGNVAAVYVDQQGKVNWLTKSSYDAIRKMVFFATTHFSTYGVAYKSNAPKFKDIAGHWAKDDILFVVNRGLITNTGKSKFGPDLSITRGMLVTALGRLAQANVSGYKKSSFRDISADAYYKGYAEWANKNSILKGIGDKKYAPNASITREQLAAAIDRYATVTGFKLPVLHTKCTFADADKIDSRAKDAVQRLQMAGIISSKSGNRFDPKGKVTRAEVSAMLKCFIELTITYHE